MFGVCDRRVRASLSTIADPAQVSDAKGCAWFWSFLARIGFVVGLVSWRVARAPERREVPGPCCLTCANVGHCLTDC